MPLFDKLVRLWLGDPKFMNAIIVIAEFLRACHFVGIAQDEYLYAKTVSIYPQVSSFALFGFKFPQGTKAVWALISPF